MPEPLPVTPVDQLAWGYAIQALDRHRLTAPSVCRHGISVRIARIADGYGDDLPEVLAVRLALLDARVAAGG